LSSKSNHEDPGASESGKADSFLQKLGRDTRRYVPAALVPAAASLTGVLIYTRIFDSAEYGRYALVIASVMLSSTLFSGWIQQSILRYLPRFRMNQDLAGFTTKTLGLLTLVCAAVAVVSILAFAAARPVLGFYERLYLPALALLAAEILFLNVNTLYQAGLKSRQFAAYKITASIIRLAFALGFVFFVKRDIVGLIGGAALGQLLLMIPMTRGLKVLGSGVSPRPGFDPGLFRTFAAYGFPLVAWTLGSQLLNLSDRYIIGFFRGSAEVGIYSANYNLVNMGFGLVSMPLLMAAHPLIMTAWEKGSRDEVPGVVGSFSRWYIIAVIPVVLVVSVFSSEIARFLLGVEFREGSGIIPWVLGGAAAWGLSQLGHKGLELKEKTGVMCALVAVSALVKIGLNLLLVPRYGYYAAAVATLVSFLLYPVLVHVVVRSYVRWHFPWRAAARAAAAAVLTGAVLVAAKQKIPDGFPVVVELVAGAAVGVCLYAVLLVLIGEVKRGELRSLLGKN